MNKNSEYLSDNLLAQSKIIGGLHPKFHAYFGRMAKRIQLKKGQPLFFQGDEGDAIYVVEEGSIEISVIGKSGKKLSLNVMRPPDVFGEIAALDGGLRTATATAWELSWVYQIHRTQILDAISTYPEFSAEIVRILCERVRWVSQQVEDLALLDMEVRLARQLLILHTKFSDKDGNLQISQSRLADFLGSTRETINKILQLWRANGLITLSRGALKICNHSGLEQLAGLS